MVFIPLCRGNQIGGLYHLQGFLAKCCITNGFLMSVMYRHGFTIVNKKNCDFDTFKISQYIAKTVVSLSPSVCVCVCACVRACVCRVHTNLQFLIVLQLVERN